MIKELLARLVKAVETESSTIERLANAIQNQQHLIIESLEKKATEDGIFLKDALKAAKAFLDKEESEEEKPE